MSPQRIQRRRTRGWRMPEGAVYVGRPSKWGNPFTVAGALEQGWATDEADARAFAVECFEDWLVHGRFSQWWFAFGAERHAWMLAHLDDLYGRDLACWCPPSGPCHADVLLRLVAGGVAHQERAS